MRVGFSIGSSFSTMFTVAASSAMAHSHKPLKRLIQVLFVESPHGLPKSFPAFWIFWAAIHLSSSMASISWISRLS